MHTTYYLALFWLSFVACASSDKTTETDTETTTETATETTTDTTTESGTETTTETDTETTTETGTETSTETDTETQDAFYGPENTWFHANLSDVPSDLSGTGYELGDTAYNFTMQDQFGDEVELYQFYGQVIVFDVLAEWCHPCIEHAPEGEAFYQEIADQGVVYIALMQEQTNELTPDASAAARWADTYGLSHPVLADSEQIGKPFADLEGGYPSFPVIGPDMTIISSDLFPPNVAELTALLESEGIW